MTDTLDGHRASDLMAAALSALRSAAAVTPTRRWSREQAMSSNPLAKGLGLRLLEWERWAAALLEECEARLRVRT